ncbi:MAG: imm11 family protein, partial [Planctomyces sp.]
MEVFQLRPVLDNPLFEGFGSGSNPSILGRKSISYDFFPDDINIWDWTLEPLADKWKPIVVEGRTRSFNDFPCLDLMIPAFSHRAVDVLRDYLEPNGELLPLIHPAGEYYAYNCHRIVEVLDHEKTKAPWRSSVPQMTQSVDYFAFYADRLTGLTIFRLREMPNLVFVATPFVERAREHGLNGFHFKKVWPFPEGVSYWWEDKKNEQAANQIRTAEGLTDIKAQSLVICLPLAEGKLSKDEK